MLGFTFLPLRCLNLINLIEFNVTKCRSKLQDLENVSCVYCTVFVAFNYTERNYTERCGPDDGHHVQPTIQDCVHSLRSFDLEI